MKRKIRLVYVEWEDAAKSDMSWMRSADLDGFVRERFVVKCVGFLLEKTKRQIVLATEFGSESEFKSEQWGGVIRIPNPWIRKFETLRVVNLSD